MTKLASIGLAYGAWALNINDRRVVGDVMVGWWGDG